MWTTRRRAISTRSLRLRRRGRLVRVAAAAEGANEAGTGGEAGRGERGREAAEGERGREFFRSAACRATFLYVLSYLLVMHSQSWSSLYLGPF